MKKLLNMMNLYTRSQYEFLQNKLELAIKEKNEKSEIIFNFDKLLENYGPQQLNALFYKLINFVRNDKEKDFLLDRWLTRLAGAKSSLQTKGKSSIEYN